MYVSLIILSLFLSGCTHNLSVAKLAKASVTITNLQKNSGGSGTIIQSGPDSSLILTNGHVCKLALNGALVTTDDNKSYPVVSYVLSKAHDLCLIKIAVNLGIQTEVATEAPPTYSKAIIVGHPSLLPTIVTSGHFSGKHVIGVMMGYRDCTPAESADPQAGIFCLLGGGKIPEVKNFDAIVVSALIMPGSSGSAIYNAEGKISALVFAGRDQLGYSESVPQEYINFFLTKELPGLEVLTPNSNVELSAVFSNSKSYYRKIKSACENDDITPVQQLICNLVESDSLNSK